MLRNFELRKGYTADSPDPASGTNSRRSAAKSVNAVLTATYWLVGKRIVEYDQGGQERAAYGSKVVKRLSADLGGRFGRGFSERNLDAPEAGNGLTDHPDLRRAGRQRATIRWSADRIYSLHERRWAKHSGEEAYRWKRA